MSSIKRKFKEVLRKWLPVKKYNDIGYKNDREGDYAEKVSSKFHHLVRERDKWVVNFILVWLSKVKWTLPNLQETWN